MADKPEVGFQFGVEGDQALLSTIQALRNELKQLHQQQQETTSSAESLQRAWSSLIYVAGALELVKHVKEAADFSLQMRNLSLTTGMSVVSLAGLHDSVGEMGGDFDRVSVGLSKMLKAQQDAVDGNKKAIKGFHDIGISVAELKRLSPEQLFYRVADGFRQTGSAAERNQAAVALFGRGGRELIAMFDLLGPEIQQHIKEMGEASGVTDKATEASVRFKVVTEQMSVEGRKLGSIFLPILSAIGLGLAGVGVVAANVFEIVAGILVTLFEGLKAQAEIAFDLARGDFKGAVEDAKQAGSSIKTTWKNVGSDLKGSWSDLGRMAKAAFGQLPPQIPTGGDDNKPGKPEPARERGDRIEAGALRQHAQDELALYRELAKGREEQDKRDYDQGLLSLQDYFNRRRGAIQAAFTEELKALGAEKIGVQSLLVQAQARSTTTAPEEVAKKREIRQLTDQITHIEVEEARELARRDAELDKNEDARAKAKQDHLLKELEAQKKLADLEGSRVKSAQLAIEIEDLQLRKELEQLGKTKVEIDAFIAQYSSARNIRTTVTDTQRGFEGGEAQLAETKTALQEKVADYQLQPYQAERQLRAEYEKEIPILQAKVQLLRQQAAAAQAAAEARGEKGPNAEAVDIAKQADQDETKLLKLRTEMTKMDTTWMSWRTEALQAIDQVSTHLTTGLNGWIEGHQRFGDALKQTWNSIVMTGVTSLEKLGAQWISHHLKMLLIKQTTNAAGLASDTTTAAAGESIRRTTGLRSVLMAAKLAAVHAFKSVFETVPFPLNIILAPAAAAGAFIGAMAVGAFAEGGYIRGSGSSRSDSIPVMLSNGEYVVKADAVRRVGVSQLDSINKGFADGGAVGSSSSSSAGTAVPRSTSGDPNLAKAMNGNRIRVEIAHVDAKLGVGHFLLKNLFGGMFGFAAGGYAAMRFVGGGFLRGPGSTTSDSIPAMLSDKEYVVNARGVQSIGVETLDQINRGAFRGAFLPPIRHPAPYSSYGMSHLAAGGGVRNLVSPGGSKPGITVHAPTSIQSSSIDSKDFRDHLDDHLDYIADGLKGRMRDFRF